VYYLRDESINTRGDEGGDRWREREREKERKKVSENKGRVNDEKPEGEQK
jgi:hypothetical protein